MSTTIALDLVARGGQSAAAAAAAAAYKATVEVWTLFAIGVAVTVLRTYSRARAVGFSHLQADDYLVWVGIIFYAAQSSLAYEVIDKVHGLANSGMTPAQRAALSPSSPEYHLRVLGSKIQVAGWASYVALIASFKLSMLAFYVRLMDGLGRRYRIPIHVGFAMVIGCFIASIITIMTACRPFHKYWQIYPNPGNVCQAGISTAIVWVTFASNIVTDLYLIFIPIPMLWGSRLKLLKKIGATFILSAGVFVLVCATLKSAFVLADPIQGAQLAGEWGTRETFVACIVTNLPMLFHLLKTCLRFLFGSAFDSSHRTYKTPSAGFRSFGGGGGDSFSRNRRGDASTDPTTIDLTFNESEERMVDGVKMQNMKVYATAPETPSPAATTTTTAPGGIVVSNQVDVTTESRSSHNGERPAQDVHETW